MKQIYTNEQISTILDQSVIYQCACPAQVCEQINQLRRLYAYQANCLNLTNTDIAVHDRIANTAAKSHAEMEECLTEILRLEGWNLETLAMPEVLKTRILAAHLMS